MPVMRAKFRINAIQQHSAEFETVHMMPVARNGGYPADGFDEDNTFAKFTPQGTLSLAIANPALIGMFEVGETYYLDFTKAG